MWKCVESYITELTLSLTMDQHKLSKVLDIIRIMLYYFEVITSLEARSAISTWVNISGLSSH